MDKTQGIHVYTYADLRRVHTERLQTSLKSTQQVRNHLSAFNQFASLVGKADSSPCGKDFTANFEGNLYLFVDALKVRGVTPATIANSVSCVRAIQNTFRAMQLGLTGDCDFISSLRALVKGSGKGIRKVEKESGICIHSWVEGHIPRRSSIGKIKRLEDFFNIPEGSLVSKIDFKPPTGDSIVIKSRERHIHLKNDTYIYKNPTPEIIEEWRSLIHFYTAPYLLNGMTRNSAWRVKPVEKITADVGWEGQAPNGVCVTAQIRWRFVSSFFGYLLRTRDRGGKGIAEEQLSLALISDANLVTGYIEFRRNRSEKYTSETLNTLTLAISFLREKTGFLWQQPAMGERLNAPVPHETWQKWCNENRLSLLNVKQGLEKGLHIQKGRDPKEPIALILAEPHPVHVLIRMVGNMEKRLVLAQCKGLRAIFKRNILLVKMLISNPLRVHHYSMMTYRNDNGGNLYQDASGAWRLRFAPEDFKNQRGAAAKEYDVLLPPWLYDDIEEYINIYRHFFFRVEHSDRVFLPKRQGSTRQGADFYWMPVSITECLKNLTKEFIPNSPGFGAHAFRHIIATDYIKNNPNGYQVAANILHDKLTTVLREYAHVKVADGFSHWTAYLEKQVSAARRSDHE